MRFFSFVQGGPPKGLCLSLVSFLFLSFLTCLVEGIVPSCFRLRCYKGEVWALVSRGRIFPIRGWSGSLDWLGVLFSPYPRGFLYSKTTNTWLKKERKRKKKKSILFPWFFTLPGISFTTPVLQNITSFMLISKIHAENPQTVTWSAITRSALTWDCHLRILTLNDCHRLGPSCRCTPWTIVHCQDPVTAIIWRSSKIPTIEVKR